MVPDVTNGGEPSNGLWSPATRAVEDSRDENSDPCRLLTSLHSNSAMLIISEEVFPW